MAVQVKIRKKDGKFRLWSTATDSWYFGDAWLTREEAVAYLQARIMARARAEYKDIEKTFPNGYWSRDGKRYWFDEPTKLK